MKGLAALMVLLAAIVTARSGPSSAAGTFTPSIIRQDFTGHGTFHRVGLIREQNSALTAQRTAQTRPSRAARSSFLARLWQSLFRRNPSTSNPTPP